MTIKFVRKLEIVHKEVGVVHNGVGGYVTRCALPRRLLKLIIITQSVRNVSLELKSNLEITEIREGEQDDAP